MDARCILDQGQFGLPPHHGQRVIRGAQRNGTSSFGLDRTKDGHWLGFALDSQNGQTLPVKVPASGLLDGLVDVVADLELLARHASKMSPAEVERYTDTAFKGVQRLHGEIEDILKYLHAPALAQPGSGFNLSRLASLVAEIGDVIHCHLVMIGMIEEEGPDEHQRKLIEEKRAEFEKSIEMNDAEHESEFPDGAQLCKKCSTKAMIQTVLRLEKKL